MRLPDIRKIKDSKEILRFGIYFLLILAISAGVFGFKKLVDGYLGWRATRDIYPKLLAQLPADYSFLKPFRNWSVENLDLGAKAVVSMEVGNGRIRVLFEKNADKPLPIASLSKLFSAYLFIENYDLNKEVKISKEAVRTEEETGFFWIGERFTVKDLLYSVLLESSNDATYALAEVMGVKDFVGLMNSQAKEVGLKNYIFVDPIGLDPDYSWERFNQASAHDLGELLSFITSKARSDARASLLLEITRTPEFYLYRADESFHHKIRNTNRMLSDYKDSIITGKTGQTPLAGECFALVIKHPRYEDGYIVNVVLGSKDRFSDMEKLINWVRRAYIW